MIPDAIKYFFNESDLETEIVEGDIERVIYSGENIQTILYHFPPNKVFPVHVHDQHEQLGYLVSGKMGFMVGGEERTLLPGDFYRALAAVEQFVGVVNFEVYADMPEIMDGFILQPGLSDDRGGDQDYE